MTGRGSRTNHMKRDMLYNNAARFLRVDTAKNK